ncbi:MAG TPA: phosphohistidine phosphatase SixA [Alteromonas sp.]|nr:phosphohistidine phosphatase SixA [Alteromonas sp.]
MSGQSSKDDILIFIMRHGEAEGLLTDDKSRRLTAVGNAEVGASSHWLAESYCPDNQIATALVSPYTRTRQSYQQVASTSHASQFEICADITPDGNVKLVHDYVDVLARQSIKNNAGQPLLLVSHMPFVSFFLDEICDVPKMSLFATGSVAVVRYSLSRSKGVLLKHYQGL